MGACGSKPKESDIIENAVAEQSKKVGDGTETKKEVAEPSPEAVKKEIAQEANVDEKKACGETEIPNQEETASSAMIPTPTKSLL
ncbi:unnamed protein product [Cochlearia groenlandica]